MNPVSHPLIADIAHARSSNRPDAPAREPRREDEKFSIREVPQAARERQEIPEAPVAPVSPIRPRVDHAPETQDTAASTQTASPAPETDKASVPPAAVSAVPPPTPASSSPGLIAGIAGIATDGSTVGQALPAVAPATQTMGGSDTSATTGTAQPNATQTNVNTADTQANAATVVTQPQIGNAAGNEQTNQSAITTNTSPAATAPSTTSAQPPQAAQQIAAAVIPARTGPGGTTPSATTTSGSTTAAGKNAALDQQSGESEGTGVTVKKPVSAFATGVSTAFSGAETAAKPPQTQVSTQILAQAMASAPATATVTPEVTPPSLTAPPPVTGDALGVTQSFNAEMRAAIDAPTQAAAYTARGAVTAQPAAEQIAMQITRAADQNIDRMTVHLKPMELGKVTIDLEVGPDNRLLAVISAERSETLDLLQRDSKSLEKALNDAGIETDAGSLEFSLKGEGGTAENGGDEDGKLHDGAVMLPGDIDAADVNGAPMNTPLILPEGRIDIQV